MMLQDYLTALSGELDRVARRSGERVMAQLHAAQMDINCVAMDCRDAGYDVDLGNMVVRDCTAMDCRDAVRTLYQAVYDCYTAKAVDWADVVRRDWMRGACITLLGLMQEAMV